MHVTWCEMTTLDSKAVPSEPLSFRRRDRGKEITLFSTFDGRLDQPTVDGGER